MDALPPDPYAALGVAKDATTAHIKQQYRKLVLKLHPDKVQDESLKQAAADQFHKVQSAYEIVSDDDRRQRYDAQYKLEQLRRDAMERGGVGRGGPDVRTAAFRMPTESARGGEFYARGPERSGRMSPQFEERAPRFDYFDAPPRPTARKDNDYERSSKRAPPREDPKKSRTSAKKSKENERSSREERSRRTDQDVRKERERKNAFAFQQSPTSDSDEYDRARRQAPEEDHFRRARAADEEIRRRKDEDAVPAGFGDDRASKYTYQESQARAYQAAYATSPQERSPTDRRPSPTRKQSSRENVEYIKRKDGKPPVMIRRGSGKPDPSREPRKSSSREKDIDIVDEPQEMPRRPPTLNKMNSSPPEIRPPFERQRSSSLQYDPRDPPIPSIKRAETMPYPRTTDTTGESRRKESSKLRTEVPQNAYPTPESSPERAPRKGSYPQTYADENDYFMPESYRTEYREPTSPRNRTFTRSPPPMEDYRETREKQRTSTSKPAPPQPKRTTSTTYAFPSPTEAADGSIRRPSLQREGSSRLFGEIPTVRSPRPSQSKYPPPADVSYSPKLRPEDIKMTTGYKGRRPTERTHSSRSGTPLHVR